jgi:tetratricopeptide (TPR) repeat protein
LESLLKDVVAAIYHNLGNLELARGNPEDSLLYFNRAIQIWKVGGDETAEQLALSYLCVGRVYMLQGKLADALKITSQSESLFTGTTEINRVVITASYDIQCPDGPINLLIVTS